ncbi:MAG: hypothetical protein WDA10_03700 [Porticoccaceae bacterium]|jgi:alkylhydroperoxidase family enzyme|nr:hypothetical protein [Porticoccaceae bacterium]MEA3300832.1 hypothetical protein [Pseudomonadota bacterium]HLS99259.1 hypothetical protein [Porticoccaceae bacterium]
MTWLPLNTDAHHSDLEALLALNPANGKALTDFLAVAEQVNDSELLNLCRTRMAQLLDCRALLAGADPAQLGRLDQWSKSSDFSSAEKAALDFTELFIVAAREISPAQRRALAEALGVGEPSTFVYGLYINEALVRFLAFADVEPFALDRLLAKSTAVGEKSDRKFIEWVEGDGAETDARLLAAYYAFNRATCAANLVDALTDEMVRLRSAEYHDCKFCQSVRRIVAKPEGAGDLMGEVRDYANSTLLTPRQKTALEVLDVFLVSPAAVGDGLKARIIEHFSPAELVELLMKEMFWMSNKPMISLGTDPGAVSAASLTPFEYDAEGNFVLLAG